MIRMYQPDVVLGNAPTDRHPDHGRAARLIYDACFLSGLPKIETKLSGASQEAWRPKAYYNYVQFLHIEPDFVVDISDYFQKKMEAVMAYKSQFYDPDSKEPETFISSPDFFSFLEATYISFGKPLGVRYAEGYIKNRYVGVQDITQLL
jgi:bacillithiol biosynthesis deacetylase BshB1